MMKRVSIFLLSTLFLAPLLAHSGSAPYRARRGVVVSQNQVASQIGWKVLETGGNAIDAAIATAFALAVLHPTAGNIGGGGFLVFRASNGDSISYDFREVAPKGAHPKMWLKGGVYDAKLHHLSHLAVGVPGTVAGLHLAWKEHGSKPWAELVAPAIKLASDGFEVSDGLASSLASVLEEMKNYPASMAQFSKNGKPYEAGDILKQEDLGRTLKRIAVKGPADFYEGETAKLIETEMTANGGLITKSDLKSYRAKKREVIKGNYRGYEVIGMGPPSSGGIAVIQMLNVLEAFDLKANGYASAKNVHLITEVMRRAFADRAQYLGDPDFVANIPVTRLTSKEYAASKRSTISLQKASISSKSSFEWPHESAETTHFSIVDEKKNAVALTFTLEQAYGSCIVVPGAGFLLNNEMGDFNAAPNLTNENGLIGTSPNLAQRGKRMLSSMSPTIVSKDGKLFMVTGSPGGRTIINTVLLTLINVIDFGMNAQAAVDAGRFHHQWLPDKLYVERFEFSTDTLGALEKLGHKIVEVNNQGVAEVIVVNQNQNILEAGFDRRAPDGGASGK